MPFNISITAFTWIISFFQNFRVKLMERAVTYFNVDNSVNGNESVLITSVPHLKTIMLTTAQKVQLEVLELVP